MQNLVESGVTLLRIEESVKVLVGELRRLLGSGCSKMIISSDEK